MRTNRRADRWADRWTGPVAWACTPSLPFQAAGNLAEAFCPYRSIPASFWWAIVTMTTVGYGDGYPMTAEGRTLAVFAMISGILIIAMPITVIGDNFSKAYDSQSFEESLIARCTRQVSAREAKPGMEEGTDMIQLEVLMQLLRELELRGNLKVQRPKDIEALTKLLAEYDAGGDGVLRMQEREWRVFLHDVVIDPSDFTNATVSKLARDVHNAQVEAAPRPHMTATTRPRPNPSTAPTRIRAPLPRGGSGVGGTCRATEPTPPQLASHEVESCLPTTCLLNQVESARLHTKLDEMRSDLRLAIDAIKKKKG